MFQSPPQRGESLVAAHQAYLYRYLAADEAARNSMREDLGEDDNPGARTRLRRALLSSAPPASSDSLKRAVAEFDALVDSTDLTKAERNAVRVWRSEAAERLELRRQVQELNANVADVKGQLEEAKKQIEQLTIIEQQLESSQPEPQQPEDDNEGQDQQ